MHHKLAAVTNIKYSISNIKHQTSNIKYRISNIKHQISNITYQTSRIKHQISNIKDRRSNIRYQMSDIRCQMNIKYQIPGIKYRISNIKFQISNVKKNNIKYQISSIKYQISNIKYQISNTNSNVEVNTFFFLNPKTDFEINESAIIPDEKISCPKGIKTGEWERQKNIFQRYWAQGVPKFQNMLLPKSACVNQISCSATPEKKKATASLQRTTEYQPPAYFPNLTDRLLASRPQKIATT